MMTHEGHSFKPWFVISDLPALFWVEVLFVWIFKKSLQSFVQTSPVDVEVFLFDWQVGIAVIAAADQNMSNMCIP